MKTFNRRGAETQSLVGLRCRAAKIEDEQQLVPTSPSALSLRLRVSAVQSR